MKLYIQTVKAGMVCLLLTFATQFSFAQSQSTTDPVVSGTVLTATEGDPLPGVNVLIAGTTKGTITDAEGKFRFESGLKAGDKLVFSYLSYISQTYTVVGGEPEDITIRMVDNAEILTEAATQEVYSSNKARRGIFKVFRTRD